MCSFYDVVSLVAEVARWIAYQLTFYMPGASFIGWLFRCEVDVGQLHNDLEALLPKLISQVLGGFIARADF